MPLILDQSQSPRSAEPSNSHHLTRTPGEEIKQTVLYALRAAISFRTRSACSVQDVGSIPGQKSSLLSLPAHASRMRRVVAPSFRRIRYSFLALDLPRQRIALRSAGLFRRLPRLLASLPAIPPSRSRQHDESHQEDCSRAFQLHLIESLRQLVHKQFCSRHLQSIGRPCPAHKSSCNSTPLARSVLWVRTAPSAAD